MLLQYVSPSLQVYLGLPYNDRADVYSFACIMYELFSRSMSVFTFLSCMQDQEAAVNMYAAAIADGFRPDKPNKIPEEVRLALVLCIFSGN